MLPNLTRPVSSVSTVGLSPYNHDDTTNVHAAGLFLKVGGGIVISIKANCIDSTAAPEAVFAQEVAKLREMGIKPKEQLTLEPFERDHAMVVGVYQRAQ